MRQEPGDELRRLVARIEGCGSYPDPPSRGLPDRSMTLESRAGYHGGPMKLWTIAGGLSLLAMLLLSSPGVRIERAPATSARVEAPSSVTPR